MEGVRPLRKARPSDAVVLFPSRCTSKRAVQLKVVRGRFYPGAGLFANRERDGGLQGEWVPMTKQLCRELAAWSEDRQAMAGMDQEYVFVCLSNTAFCDDYYGKPFQKRQHFMEKLHTKVGVKPFGFHSIRHLFASRLWRKNVHLGHIQQLLRIRAPGLPRGTSNLLGLRRSENRFKCHLTHLETMSLHNLDGVFYVHNLCPKDEWMKPVGFDFENCTESSFHHGFTAPLVIDMLQGAGCQRTG